MMGKQKSHKHAEKYARIVLSDFPQFMSQDDTSNLRYAQFNHVNIGFHIGDDIFKDGIHIDCTYCRKLCPITGNKYTSNAYTIIDITNPNHKEIIEKFIMEHSHAK